MAETSTTSASLVTVLARAKKRGLVLTPAQLAESGRRAAAIYRRVYEAEPQRAPEIVVPAPESRPDLVLPTRVFAYAQTDVPMIDAAINSVLEDKPAPYPTKRGTKTARGPANAEDWERWKQDMLLVMTLERIVQKPGTIKWTTDFAVSVARRVRGGRTLTDKQRSTVSHEIDYRVKKEEWDSVVAEWAKEFGDDEIEVKAPAKSDRDDPAEF